MAGPSSSPKAAKAMAPSQVDRVPAGKTPPGQWVIGNKYDDTKLAEERPANRHDLDEAVPLQPAIIRHRGGHTAVVNSRGLEVAGITADTPDPEGGRFGRENGELTGFVAEEALEVILAAGEWPEITRAVRQQGVAHLSRAMAAAGDEFELDLEAAPVGDAAGTGPRQNNTVVLQHVKPPLGLDKWE